MCQRSTVDCGCGCGRLQSISASRRASTSPNARTLPTGSGVIGRVWMCPIPTSAYCWASRTKPSGSSTGFARRSMDGLLDSVVVPPQIVAVPAEHLQLLGFNPNPSSTRPHGALGVPTGARSARHFTRSVSEVSMDWRGRVIDVSHQYHDVKRPLAARPDPRG